MTHLNGTTLRDMTTSLNPKKRTGPRISTRLTIIIPTTALSDRFPALLDQSVETKEGDTNKLETVQEAVAAANAAADMSRRTWTQARQLMKDLHRSRGNFPVSKGNSMEVDQGKGKSRVARRDAPTKDKENTRDRAREKAKEDALDHVFRARDLTGLATVLHIMEERVSAPLHLAMDQEFLTVSTSLPGR